MCRWLSYGTQNEEAAGANLLHKRELSFTTGDDVYIRYLSYEEPAAFKKDLLSKLPHKIDIGAIFSAAPRDHKKFKLFEPHQREFIIDIDLTDAGRSWRSPRASSPPPCARTLASSSSSGSIRVAVVSTAGSATRVHAR
jgi:DNA primase catalytic subunit